MKGLFPAVLMLMSAAGMMCAQSEVRDSVRVAGLSEESLPGEVTALLEVVVKAFSAPRMTPALELTGSYGSYGTWRAGGQFSTDLLGRHWVLDGAYHETSTNGYLHGTQGRSGSYTGGLAWLSTDRRLVVKYSSIGNRATVIICVIPRALPLAESLLGFQQPVP